MFDVFRTEPHAGFTSGLGGSRTIPTRTLGLTQLLVQLSDNRFATNLVDGKIWKCGFLITRFFGNTNIRTVIVSPFALSFTKT